jgi:hypothetical protein
MAPGGPVNPAAELDQAAPEDDSAWHDAAAHAEDSYDGAYEMEVNTGLDVGEARRRPRPKRRRRRRGPGVELAQDDEPNESEWEIEDDDAEEPVAPQQESRPRPKAEEEASPRPRWPIIVGVVLLIVLIAGAGGYLALRKGDSDKAVAKKTRSTSKSGKAAPPPAKQEAAPTVGPELVIKPKGDEVVKLSAARLAAELAAHPAETNRKYEAVTLEVTGLFKAIEVKQSLRPLPRQHAVFNAEGPPISCDLLQATPPELSRWIALTYGEPFTARGVYSKDGFLHNCQLRPLTPPADAKYRGKEIELAGVVDAVQIENVAFPTIQFERETNSTLLVECLFRKTDQDEVKKVQPGSLVTVKGTCNGRVSTPGGLSIRLDNCELVYTTAPVPPTQRFDVVQCVRDYQEDLITLLLPPPGSEPRVDYPLTVTQLSKDFTADAKGLEMKYRNKVLIVAGKLQAKQPPTNVTLESGDTDQALKVRCRFTRQRFAELGPGPDLLIRGLCTAIVPSTRTLQLDNCELYDPSGKSSRRLTADYLPHTSGRTLIRDSAVYTTPGKKHPVTRQAHYQREGGLTETVTTHVGVLGTTLLATDEPGKWAAERATRKVRIPGPVYYYRLYGGFIELGQRLFTRSGGLETAWEPALKIGARTGESWKWSQANDEHQYTLLRFDDYRSRPSAVVRETVTRASDPHHPLEVLHTYVQGVGEVERQEVLLVTSKDRQILAESRFVEDAAPTPPKESPRDTKSRPIGAEPGPTKDLPKR